MRLLRMEHMHRLTSELQALAREIVHQMGRPVYGSSDRSVDGSGERSVDGPGLWMKARLDPPGDPPDAPKSPPEPYNWKPAASPPPLETPPETAPRETASQTTLVDMLPDDVLSHVVGANDQCRRRPLTLDELIQGQVHGAYERKTAGSQAERLVSRSVKNAVDLNAATRCVGDKAPQLSRAWPTQWSACATLPDVACEERSPVTIRYVLERLPFVQPVPRTDENTELILGETARAAYEKLLEDAREDEQLEKLLLTWLCRNFKHTVPTEWRDDTLPLKDILADAELTDHDIASLWKAEQLHFSNDSPQARTLRHISQIVRINESITDVQTYKKHDGVVKEVVVQVMDDYWLTRQTQVNLYNSRNPSRFIDGVQNMLRFNASIKELRFNTGHIRGNVAEQLAAAVLNSTSVEEFNHLPIQSLRANEVTNLDMHYARNRFDFEVGRHPAARVRLGPVEARVIASLLTVNGSLRSLDLSFNTIGDEGAQVIAKSLHENRSLTELDVRYNNFSNKGAQEIGASLRVNPSLTKLDVRHNHIRDDAAKQLAAAVLQNQSMEEFNLIPIKRMRYNDVTTLLLHYEDVGPVGAWVILSLLTENDSLTSIDIGSNGSARRQPTAWLMA